jgi:hypothetical protein
VRGRLGGSFETIFERVLHGDSTDGLSVLQVFGKQLFGSCKQSGLNDQRIPEAELMALLEERGRNDDVGCDALFVSASASCA